MIFTLKIAKHKRADALMHHVLIMLTMGNDELLFEHVVLQFLEANIIYYIIAIGQLLNLLLCLEFYR